MLCVQNNSSRKESQTHPSRVTFSATFAPVLWLYSCRLLIHLQRWFAGWAPNRTGVFECFSLGNLTVSVIPAIEWMLREKKKKKAS